MKKVILSTLFVALITVTALNACSSKNNEKKSDALSSSAAGDEDLVKRGGYLVSVMGCEDCHSPKKMGPNGPELEPELRLSGYPSSKPLPPVDSNVIKKGWVLLTDDLTAGVGPWGVSYAANITSDETGIGNWTEDQFRKALTEGKWKGMDNGRTLLPPMPWQSFSNLAPEDVKAIFLFLKSTKPVKNIEPPVQSLNAL